MKKLLPIILFIFFISSYANSNKIVLKPFSTLVIRGPVHLKIINGVSNSQMLVEGSQNAIDALNFKASHNKLFVSASVNKPLSFVIHARHLQNLETAGDSNMVVNIMGDSRLAIKKTGAGNLTLNGRIALYHLDYFGTGSVTIHQMTQAPLRIKYRGSGDIVLQGVTQLESLDFNGSGHLSMLWVDSRSLTVRACGSGLIELAGVACHLQANVYDKVAFDARFLRTQSAAVITHDDARADLYVLDNMYTLAMNHSNIYYYRKPVFFYREMRQSGAILDMTLIPGAYLHF